MTEIFKKRSPQREKMYEIAGRAGGGLHITLIPGKSVDIVCGKEKLKLTYVGHTDGQVRLVFSNNHAFNINRVGRFGK